MMKYISHSTVLIIFLILSVNIQGQTITIGTGTTDRWIPINSYYGYSYSQSIFDQSEIGLSGDIDKIRYYFNGNSAFTDNPVDVYIGHTTKSTFSSSSDWIPTSSLTLVYSGSITTSTSAGWVEIDITDFSYNNVNNLIIAVHEKQSSYHGSSDDYYSTACTGNKTIYVYRDSPIIDPTNPPTGNTQAYRLNIQLEFTSVTNMSYVSSTTSQNNTTTVNPGETTKEIIGIEVVTSGSGSPFNLTQFQINMNGSTDCIADISNIEIYYTGLSTLFSTSDLYGNSTPSTATISINGSQTLLNGTNHFWISYDITGGASPGNYIDAECTQIIPSIL